MAFSTGLCLAICARCGLITSVAETCFLRMAPASAIAVEKMMSFSVSLLCFGANIATTPVERSSGPMLRFSGMQTDRPLQPVVGQPPGLQLTGGAYFFASRIKLKGVSVARRKRLKPASVNTLRKRATRDLQRCKAQGIVTVEHTSSNNLDCRSRPTDGKWRRSIRIFRARGY